MAGRVRRLATVISDFEVASERTIRKCLRESTLGELDPVFQDAIRQCERKREWLQLPDTEIWILVAHDEASGEYWVRAEVENEREFKGQPIEVNTYGSTTLVLLKKRRFVETVGRLKRSLLRGEIDDQLKKGPMELLYSYIKAEAERYVADTYP